MDHEPSRKPTRHEDAPGILQAGSAGRGRGWRGDRAGTDRPRTGQGRAGQLAREPRNGPGIRARGAVSCAVMIRPQHTIGWCMIAIAVVGYFCAFPELATLLGIFIASLLF